MVYLFYTTNISVDLAYHEIFHSKDGKGGISSKPHVLAHIPVVHIKPHLVPVL